MSVFSFSALLLAILVIPLVVAGVFIAWRRSYHRRLSKSPLTRRMLRPPGMRLRSELLSVQFDLSSSIFVVLLSGLYPSQVFFAHYYFFGPSSVFVLVAFVLLGVGLFGFAAYKLVRLSRRYGELRRGLECEMAVGQELDQLMKQGYSVYHDFPAEDFNIDHIVIGSNGVFAVETKGRSKRLLTAGKEYRITLSNEGLKVGRWVDRKTLPQAERQAKWLSGWLTEAVGEPVKVSPVVVFPGWYIERKANIPIPVLTDKEISYVFAKLAGQPMDAALIKRVAHQIEREVRDIDEISMSTLPEHAD